MFAYLYIHQRQWAGKLSENGSPSFLCDGYATKKKRDRGNEQRTREANRRTVTNGGQKLRVLDTLASQKSLHKQGEMLPWNAAALSGLRDDTAMPRKFHTQVGLRKFFEHSLLRLHVWKGGQARGD